MIKENIDRKLVFTLILIHTNTIDALNTTEYKTSEITKGTQAGPSFCNRQGRRLATAHAYAYSGPTELKHDNNSCLMVQTENNTMVGLTLADAQILIRL